MTDTHGLEAGMRVVEDNAEIHIEGTIRFVDEDEGTAWVRWDNGHNAFDVDVDELVPVEGW